MTNGEKRTIRELLAAATQANWHVRGVWDGEDTEPAHTTLDVIRILDNLDEGTILLRRFTAEGKPENASVFVVLGNASDGGELLADNSLNINDVVERAYARFEKR